MIKQQLSLIENIPPFLVAVPWNIRHKKIAHILTEGRFHGTLVCQMGHTVMPL